MADVLEVRPVSIIRVLIALSQKTLMGVVSALKT